MSKYKMQLIDLLCWFLTLIFNINVSKSLFQNILKFGRYFNTQSLPLLFNGWMDGINSLIQ